MAFPKNPDNILVKNKYYPKGLTEKDTWEYYQLVKTKLLKEVWNRDLMFFIATKENEVVVKRKGKDTEFIRLTRSNYDDTVHGRVLSIHSTMRKYEEFCIVDIDTDNFNLAKQATLDTLNVLKTIPIVKESTIRFSGKTSFHIYCNLYNKTNIDVIRSSMSAYLMRSDLAYKYTIGATRTTRTANLDLSPNKYNGGYITLHSLSTIGLKCIELQPNQIAGFSPNLAKI